MSWRSEEYVCVSCGYRLLEIFPKGEAPDCLDCESCGEEEIMTRLRVSAPTVLKASYPMGHKRDGAYYLIKEAARLEQKKANLPPEKRGEIQAAIDDLKRSTKKEKPKDRK